MAHSVSRSSKAGSHVAAHRIVPQVGHVHRVEHVGRDQHGHRRALLLVLGNARGQRLGEQVAQRRLELAQILDGMLALPGGVFPVFLARRPGSRESVSSPAPRNSRVGGYGIGWPAFMGCLRRQRSMATSARSEVRDWQVYKAMQCLTLAKIIYYIFLSQAVSRQPSVDQPSAEAEAHAEAHLELPDSCTSTRSSTAPPPPQTGDPRAGRGRCCARPSLTGHLRANEPLPQDEIAAQLQVSHIPVREALRQLQSEGLVTYQANRGATVSRA